MDNLDIPAVAAAQTQKEITINEATAKLSGALADYLAVDLSAGGHTLSADEFTSYMGFKTTGNAISRTLTIPATKRALFYVENGGSATLSVACGSTTLSIAAGATGMLQTDGTTNGMISIAPVAIGGEIDICVAISGKPLTAQKIIFIVNQAFSLPTSLTGSHAYVDTNPTATMDFDIAKNGSSVGTVSFNTSGVASFTFASPASFAIGDKLKITAPSPQDATGADVSINLKGTKS